MDGDTRNAVVLLIVMGVAVQVLSAVMAAWMTGKTAKERFRLFFRWLVNGKVKS